MRKHLISEVEGFEGLCTPTWLNYNQIDIRTSGFVGGFFKSIKKHWLFGWIKTGKEFHGFIGVDGKVKSSVGKCL